MSLYKLPERLDIYDLFDLGLESVQYETFHRDKVTRLSNHLVKPRLFKTKELELPKGSVYHYLPVGPEDTGPTSDLPLLGGVNKIMKTYYPLDYAREPEGVIKLSYIADEPIRKYQQRNRLFKRVFQLEGNITDNLAPFIVNYCHMGKNRSFVRDTVATRYEKNEVVFASIIQNMKNVCAVSEFKQFVVINAPKDFPSVAQMKLFENNLLRNNLTMDMKRNFNSFEKFFLLSLFLWCGNNRKLSMLDRFTMQEYDRIHFIVQDEDNEIVLCLGDLDRLRRTESNTKGLDPNVLRLKILALFINLSMYRNNTEEEIRAIREEAVADEAIKILGKPKKEKDGKDDIDSHIDDFDTEVSESIASDLKALTNDNTSLDKDIKVEDEFEDIVDEDRGTITRRNVTKELTEEQLAALEIKVLEDQIEDQLKVLDDHVEKREVLKGITQEELMEDEHREKAPEEHIQEHLDKYLSSGVISPAEVRKYQKLANSYKTIKSPFKDQPLSEFIKVDPEEIKITPRQYKDSKSILDKNMLSSTVTEWKRKYIKDIYPKDLARMTLAIQQAGACVSEVGMEIQEDAVSSYIHFALRVNPIIGKPSTIRFKVPLMNEEGVYRSNGIEYFQRSQLRDLPIRKINPTRVALTSYYGKVFVNRSDRKTHNFGRWLNTAIRKGSMDKENQKIRDTRSVNVFNHTVKTPYIYSTLSKEFKTIETDNHFLYLDYDSRIEKFKTDVVLLEERHKGVVCGVDIKKNFVLVKDDDLFYTVNGEKEELIGDIGDICGIDLSGAPMEMIELDLRGNTIPIVFAMAYEMGLSNLIKRLGVRYRFADKEKKPKLDKHEYLIKFMDETLIFDRRDKVGTMILSGLTSMQRTIRNYNFSLFDSKEIYLGILENQGFRLSQLNEIELFHQMFVDPITLDILKSMNEPITVRGLLIRACEMLSYDQHPKEVDGSMMRIVGNERIPGIVYGEIVKALRYHKNRGISRQYPIDVNPNAAWMTLAADPSVMIKKGLNPISNIKESEAVTFSGEGGRSATTMVERTRSYDPNSLGTISEATVDSGLVGVNVYLSSDPSLLNVYGITKPKDIIPGHPNFPKLMSTSSNLASCIDQDDAKRRGFVNIMMDHTVPVKKGEIAQVRTGYEQVVAHRTGKMFATTARQDGKVLSIDSNILRVQYQDGEIDNIQLGRTFGSDGGLTIPHEVITELKEGQKFTKDTPLAYNPAFFAKDPLNPDVLTWKQGVMARILLQENSLTIEDSSAISKRLSDALESSMTKIKNITVNYGQSLHRMVKVGQQLEVDDLLCIIEDPFTNQSKLFDEESIEALKALAAQAPKSGVRGVVEKIEVFYNGDRELMSPSLREIIRESDKRFVAMSKAQGKKPYTGEVSSDYRVEGEPLAEGNAVIKVYITSVVKAHGGDKGVIGNQLKTVFGKVYRDDELPYTEDGESIDGIFGAKSVSARIVNSIYTIGTTSGLLRAIAERASDIYFGRNKK